MNRVAVVTGANKGIGFGIVRALCKQFDGNVILTSRDANRGRQAVELLKIEGLRPKFHQLDINDLDSVVTFKDHLLTNYGGLDVLVNNAGIMVPPNTAPTEQAKSIMRTNFWGTLQVCDNLFPLINSGGRVVSLSSIVGSWELAKCSKEKQAQILSLKSIDELKSLVNEFVDANKDGDVKALRKTGWSRSAYFLSKTFTTSLTILQQKFMDNDETRSDILVNCCCPGFVATDMSSGKGNLSVDEGASNPVYLALLPPNSPSPKGNFVKDLKIQNWE